MNRRDWLAVCGALLTAGAATGLAGSLAGCAAPPARGTEDLGVVIGRENGTLTLVDSTTRTALGAVEGLGDLSHASVVFSRDGLFAYVFGRDGGLTQVNLLAGRIVRRVMQAGNSIGGAISDDGALIVAQNYTPGGIKVFDAHTLELLADVPTFYGPAGANQQRSRVVGLVDLPGRRFAYSLFDADAIWITDCSDIKNPQTQKFERVGHQPYDGLVTPDGRYYIAGLFGEDGMALIDLWTQPLTVRRILNGYGKGEQRLPVYKMPHLRGWAVAGRRAWFPAVGQHEVLVADTQSWALAGRVPVAGQPIFVIARPAAPQVWCTFAVPDYGHVQVIDTQSQRVIKTLEPGHAVLHMEFTPRGDTVWVSCRDDNAVRVIDTQNFETLTSIKAPSPSGVFFTTRATRIGF
ncbi:MAG: protein nirF [Burkholderiaceae bacterium]|nr:protein nirF [Burkholderiaceae bacterium]